MIAKKNSGVDLERKRTVLFQIGLLTAGSFTLAAFNYSTTTKMELEKKLYVIEGKMRYQVDRTKDMDRKVAEVTTQMNDVDMKWLIDKVEIDRCRSSQVELVQVLMNEQTKNENGSEPLW